MTAPSRAHAGSDRVSMGAARSWLADLAPEKRAAIRRLYRLRPAHNLVALVFLAIWLGTGAVVLWIPAWPVRVPGYVAMGFALHALGILMHEAVHGNFFRRQTLDRWAGFLLGAPTVVSAEAYRVTHLLHHRFNRGDKDPDEFANYLKSPRLLSLGFYGWGLLGMLVFLVHVPVNALRLGGPRERGRVIAEYGLLACLYEAALWIAVWLDATGALIHAWLVPMGVAFLIVNLRGWSEHMLTEAGHPLTQSRTVTSNALVRFFLCNLNYHLEHHLFPAVPWYNLPRLHALLQDEYRRAGSFIYGSYLRFFWDAVRAGVHGRAPKRARPLEERR
jgi:fatty acid desaturase